MLDVKKVSQTNWGRCPNRKSFNRLPMDIDQYYDKIEAYLSNALSPADKADFEAQIKAQPALKKAVLNHVLANEALGLAIEDKVSAKLDRLAAQRQATTTTKIIPIWKRPLAIAASILFLILASTVVWSTQQYSNKALATQLYAQSTVPTVRSDQAMNADFSNGLVAFSQQDYILAIDHLNKIEKVDPTYLDAKYLLGHAHLKTRDYEQAYQNFGALLSAPTPPTIDKEEVEWNQLMAAMNMDKAIFQTDLKAILANPQHAYYQKVMELNKQLSSNWRRFSLGAF